MPGACRRGPRCGEGGGEIYEKVTQGLARREEPHEPAQ